MKLFITGASGFVGKSLIRDLIKDQHEVYGLVRTNEAARIINETGAISIKGDLVEIKAFKDKLKGLDAIVHSGALVKFTGGWDEFYDVNVKASAELIDLAIEAGHKKFIYISAAAIAFDGKPLIEITEEYQPKYTINSNYLKSKMLAEREILKRKEEIQIIIFRPPVIWGPGMTILEEFRGTIKKMGFPIIGDKHHHLATCHVRNLNYAISLALFNHKAEGIFMIGDREKVEKGSFMKALLKAYDLDMGNMRIPKKIALPLARIFESIWKMLRLKGNPPMTTIMAHIMGTEFTIDCTRASMTLGYKPVISVKEGLHQLNSFVIAKT